MLTTKHSRPSSLNPGKLTNYRNLIPIRIRVPSELAKYQAALPAATARTFSDRGHFNQPAFPELVADIKNLS